MDDFTAELAKKEYIAELLISSSRCYSSQKADNELLEMADNDLDIISWLLTEKIEIANRKEYITRRLKQYKQGVFALIYQDEQGREMKFFDMRLANVLERKEELALKGISSLLIYLGKKDEGYATLKEKLAIKDASIRTVWQSIVDYIQAHSEQAFDYRLQTEDEMERRTFLRCKQLF